MRRQDARLTSHIRTLSEDLDLTKYQVLAGRHKDVDETPYGAGGTVDGEATAIWWHSGVLPTAFEGRIGKVSPRAHRGRILVRDDDPEVAKSMCCKGRGR